MASSINVHDLKGRRDNAAKLLNKRAEDLRRSTDSRIVQGNRKARSILEGKLIQYSDVKEALKMPNPKIKDWTSPTPKIGQSLRAVTLDGLMRETNQEKKEAESGKPKQN